MSAFEVEYTITADDAVDVSWTYGRSTRRRTIVIASAVALIALFIWFVSSFAHIELGQTCESGEGHDERHDEVHSNAGHRR